MFSPKKPPKPKVPEALKLEVEQKCNELVEAALKPMHIKPPPKDKDFNYPVDIYTKWHQSFFYFYVKYHCPGPNAISPYFDIGFARLEFIGDHKFNMSYMRHTEKWHEIYYEQTLDECTALIKDGGHFTP